MWRYMAASGADISLEEKMAWQVDALHSTQDSFGFHVSDPSQKPLPVITFSYASEGEARKARDLLVEALKHLKHIGVQMY
jgi:hypothetical protein